MKKTLLSLILSLCALTPLLANELILSILVTRHGDRAPFAKIDNCDYQWGTALSELTPIGMNQEFKLGQELRERYINQLKLLKPDYEALSIYTVSSHVNRTMLSAQCLLTGLYPPGTGPVLAENKPALPAQIQPIPIMTLSEDSKLLMFPYPEYLKVISKYVYNTKAWKDKQKELKPDFEKWSKILGNKINGLDDILTIGDVLIVAKAHGKPLPQGLSQEDADKIIDVTSWGLADQFKSQSISYIQGAQLVNLIAKNLNDTVSGKSKYKLIYYSGHDLTLLEIFGTLGTPLKNAPKYAANIQFELYKNNEDYQLKVRYNGEFVKLPMMNENNSCSLKEFTDYVKELNQKYSKK